MTTNSGPSGPSRRRARAPGIGARVSPGVGPAIALAFLLGLWLVLASSSSVGAASPEAGSSPPPATAPLATGPAAPSPSTGIIDTGDPRSNGQGPGLVGSPFDVLVGVVLLGLVAAAGTLLYVRVTRRS